MYLEENALNWLDSSCVHFPFLCLCRAGDAAGVVVRHRMHTIHRPSYGGQVWQGARYCHPQPQL